MVSKALEGSGTFTETWHYPAHGHKGVPFQFARLAQLQEMKWWYVRYNQTAQRAKPYSTSTESNIKSSRF